MSVLLALPREIRDEIYSYFIPDFSIRYHLRSSTWQELEESDAESCSAATASTCIHSDSARGPGSTIFTDEEDLDEEERQFKAGIRALVLLNKQVHAEYLDALARLAAETVLYLYMENTPERPHEFVFNQDGFQRFGYKRAVQKLIVLARWHAGEHWEKVIVLDENWKAKLPNMTGAANVPSSESDGAHAKPTEGPETSDERTELIDILENKPPSPIEFPDAVWVSIGQEPSIRSFFNAFDQSRGRHTFNPREYQFPNFSEPKRIGGVHAVRNPGDLLNASQAVDTLFGAVKRIIQALPNVTELDITLDVGGATSEDLAVMNITQPDMNLNVKQFLEWKPVLEDGLERIVYVNRRLLAGSYKDWPSGVEEWRMGVMEAKSGAMVLREEHGGWWDVMEEELVSSHPDRGVLSQNEPSWHIWPADHIKDIPPQPDESRDFPIMMESNYSLKHWRNITDPDTRWALMMYDPHRTRDDHAPLSCLDFMSDVYTEPEMTGYFDDMIETIGCSMCQEIGGLCKYEHALQNPPTDPSDGHQETIP